MQADQMSADLASERSNSQKIDAERAMLDRQNKDLHAKLSELEAQLKTRTKAAMQALESKIANLEEQLDAEARLAKSMSSPPPLFYPSLPSVDSVWAELIGC